MYPVATGRRYVIPVEQYFLREPHTDPIPFLSGIIIPLLSILDTRTAETEIIPRHSIRITHFQRDMISIVLHSISTILIARNVEARWEAQVQRRIPLPQLKAEVILSTLAPSATIHTP